jgi:hypothetical protein
VECDAVPPPASPSASDRCDPAPGIRFAQERVDGVCPGNYTLFHRWLATDHCGNSALASQILTVQDTTPPVVEGWDGDLACLWPANHWYVCFGSTSFNPEITDNCSEPITWSFSGCGSNQPEDAPDPAWPGWNGDGDTLSDCVLGSQGTGFCVRAERAGAGPKAQEGRRYRVEIVAADACGNSSLPAEIGKIHVPHDQSPQRKSCLKSTKEGIPPGQPLPD